MSVEPTHNRQEDLEVNIQDTLELIREYEDKRRLSSDPKEQRNYERQIADLRKLLEGYEAELAKLRKTYSKTDKKKLMRGRELTLHLQLVRFLHLNILSL